MTSDFRQQELVLPPRASSLIESLRDMGYSLRTALADVIDNSITAGAKNIQIIADTHVEFPAIGILDDGAGMSEQELYEAMRPGTMSPLESRSASDLGRFGLGLKTASFSQCRRLTVVTKKDSAISCATWDLDTVAERDIWVIEIPDNPKVVRWSDRLNCNGTLIVWEKLDRLVGLGSQEDRTDLVRQLDEARSHVEFVFHRYLSDRGNRRIVISMNCSELQPFDPFNTNHPATQHHPKEPMFLNGSQIMIWPVTLPHHDKVTPDEWNIYAGPEGYFANQGFYLYRNRRLIVHGTWFRLATKLELTKLARVGIDIPNTLDAEWKIDVRKASAQPPAPVRKRLKSIINTICEPSQRTYKGHGTKLTEANRCPIWRRVKNKNSISYEIDEVHPVMAAFSNGLKPCKDREFKRILRLVASVFPLESLHIDVSVSPKDVKSPPLSSKDLRLITTRMWDILHSRGQSPNEIQKLMRSTEPFQAQWEEASKLIAHISRSSNGAID